MQAGSAVTVMSIERADLSKKINAASGATWGITSIELKVSILSGILVVVN